MGGCSVFLGSVIGDRRLFGRDEGDEGEEGMYFWCKTGSAAEKGFE